VCRFCNPAAWSVPFSFSSSAAPRPFLSATAHCAGVSPSLSLQRLCLCLYLSSAQMNSLNFSQLSRSRSPLSAPSPLFASCVALVTAVSSAPAAFTLRGNISKAKNIIFGKSPFENQCAASVILPLGVSRSHFRPRPLPVPFSLPPPTAQAFRPLFHSNGFVCVCI